MGKLGLRSRSELIRYAHSRGYVRTTPGRILHPGFESALNAAGQGFGSVDGHALSPTELAGIQRRFPRFPELLPQRLMVRFP